MFVRNILTQVVQVLKGKVESMKNLSWGKQAGIEEK